MITHVVCWRLKENADGRSKSENLEKMKSDLESLVGQIPQIVQLRVGVNERHGDFASDIGLISRFASWEDLAVYAAHPAHQAVVQFVGKVVDERRVVDFEEP